VADSAVHLEIFFAGIRFAFEGPSALLEQLEAIPYAQRWSDAAPLAGAGAKPTVCHVTSLQSAGAEPATPSRDERRIAWAWQEGRGELRAHCASAELHATAHEVRAEARLTPNRRGAESLLTGLSAALLHRLGGAILHAASLELRGVVVALIGPSGAGKSTASRQLEDGRLFSVDRLAVAPVQGGGWLAFPMPGGTRSPLDLPPSPCPEGPLRALLRVRKAADGPRLEPCASPQAVALLRESAFHTGLDPRAEQELLAHLERLAAQVPVANLHTSLGTMFAAALGRWLAQRQTFESDQGQTVSC